MNTFSPLSQNQNITNTTSLSNGILKKLAITLAVSAIGVSTLVPIAHAGSEIVANPGDIITVTEDIYGISGNFADGGTLTVKNGGTSFADDLREAAGEDGSIGLDDFFVHVKDYPYSPSAKKFKSLMGDKIDADGNMKVEDILSVVPVFDPEDDLPIADGLTRDEVSTLFNNTFSDKSSPEQIDRYINQLVFNESQNGENVYRGFELESLPLLRTMAENSDADYRYRITALANVADDEGNITYENFQNILPAELFLKENDYYDGDNAENEDDGSDLTIGHQLLAKFQEEATDGKLSLGDAWALTYSDSGYDENDIDEYKTFLNHVGKDLILTKAELDALGVERGAKTDEVNNFWTGLQPHVNGDGKVDITTAMAFLDVTSSANDFLQEGESEFTKWNDDGRVTTQNVAHVVNEAFNQAEYKDPNRSEADFIEPNVDPQKVIAKLGSADAYGTYDADAVYDAILDVYMAEWQVDFDDGDQPKLNDIFDSVGNNGRISIDDYISLSGLTGEKETAVRALLETAADDNGEITAYEAYDAGNFDDFILEIYKKTDVDSPLSIDEILDTIPDGVTRENKDAFEEQLEELAGDDGTIARETAKEKLTEFVLENPGNELEQIDADGNILGFVGEDGVDPDGVGINLRSEKDLTLNNEVDVTAEDRAIVVISENEDKKPSGDVTVINSGDLTSGGGSILTAAGKNVTVENSGEIESYSETSRNGIHVLAAETINVTNTGEIELSTENESDAISTSSDGGDITIDNDGDLTISGEKGNGIEADSGHENEGGVFSDGGDITIKNTGKIVASGNKAIGIKSGSHGGDVTINNFADVIGDGAGIGIETAKKGTITNSGDITAKGEDSSGMFILADDTASLTNTGNVEVEGQLGLAAVALNSASIDNSGDVSLVRNWSASPDYWNPAIGVMSINDASLKNSGKVTTEGDNMIGLYAGATGSDSTKKANIENSGDVTTKGSDKAYAAFIKLDGTGTLTNAGSLTTEGKANAVVVEGTGGFTLDNAAAGVIEAKDGLAIVTGETTDKITNLGTIKGGATLAAGDDVLDNKGILEGNFDFGDGDDILNLQSLSKVAGATFDGGENNDVVNLSGGGVIAKDKTVNFETANLLSGNFSGNAMDQFTNLVNVEAGASLSGFNKVNNLTSKGTVSVAAGETLDVSGDLKIVGGKFNLGVDSTSKHALVNVSGAASFASTSNLFVNVAKNSTLKLGENVTVINGKTITFGKKIASTVEGAENEFEVDDDYISFDFSGRIETVGQVKTLILTARDSIGSTIEAVGEKFGGAIKHIAGLSGDKKSEQNSVLAKLEVLVDNGQIQEAQELMNEVVSSPGASQIASTQNTNSFTAGNMVINRAAARIDGGNTANLSADDSSNILGYNTEYKSAPHIRNIMAMTDEGTEASLAATGYNGEVWMQVYGVYQENSGKVSGQTNVFGGAAGMDFLVSPSTVFGLGLIYSNSDSDADTTNAHTNIDTDSYGITAYGMTQFDEGYRLGGSLAYYWNNHDLERQLLTNEMEADYDSTTFVARAELGKEFDMDGYTFMPQIGAIYTTNSADSYTETGPLAQSISSTDTNSFIGQVGFVVNSQQDWGGMLIRPEFHMNILHEFNDELGSYSGALAADNTVSVNGTITSTVETRYNIGGGLKLNHTTAFASEFGYDGIFAEDTQEHLFRYKASYKY